METVTTRKLAWNEYRQHFLCILYVYACVCGLCCVSVLYMHTYFFTNLSLHAVYLLLFILFCLEIHKQQKSFFVLYCTLLNVIHLFLTCNFMRIRRRKAMSYHLFFLRSFCFSPMCVPYIINEKTNTNSRNFFFNLAQLTYLD